MFTPKNTNERIATLEQQNKQLTAQLRQLAYKTHEPIQLRALDLLGSHLDETITTNIKQIATLMQAWRATQRDEVEEKIEDLLRTISDSDHNTLAFLFSYLLPEDWPSLLEWENEQETHSIREYMREHFDAIITEMQRVYAAGNEVHCIKFWLAIALEVNAENITTTDNEVDFYSLAYFGSTLLPQHYLEKPLIAATSQFFLSLCNKHPDTIPGYRNFLVSLVRKDTDNFAKNIQTLQQANLKPVLEELFESDDARQSDALLTAIKALPRIEDNDVSNKIQAFLHSQLEQKNWEGMCTNKNFNAKKKLQHEFATLCDQLTVNDQNVMTILNQIENLTTQAGIEAKENNEGFDSTYTLRIIIGQINNPMMKAQLLVAWANKHQFDKNVAKAFNGLLYAFKHIERPLFYTLCLQQPELCTLLTNGLKTNNTRGEHNQGLLDLTTEINKGKLRPRTKDDTAQDYCAYLLSNLNSRGNKSSQLTTLLSEPLTAKRMIDYLNTLPTAIEKNGLHTSTGKRGAACVLATVMLAQAEGAVYPVINNLRYSNMFISDGMTDFRQASLTQEDAKVKSFRSEDFIEVTNDSTASSSSHFQPAKKVDAESQRMGYQQSDGNDGL